MVDTVCIQLLLLYLTTHICRFSIQIQALQGKGSRSLTSTWKIGFAAQIDISILHLHVLNIMQIHAILILLCGFSLSNHIHEFELINCMLTLVTIHLVPTAPGIRLPFTLKKQICCFNFRVVNLAAKCLLGTTPYLYKITSFLVVSSSFLSSEIRRGGNNKEITYSGCCFGCSQRTHAISVRCMMVKTTNQCTLSYCPIYCTNSLYISYYTRFRAIRENIARVRGCIFTSLKDK